MVRPNYRDFRRASRMLAHSAKGSTWEDHKYIKRIDGTYYYPESYKGGRHLSSGSSGSGSSSKTDEKEDVITEEVKETSGGEKKESVELSKADIDALAKEVIRGNFGNGQIRKDLLGSNYQKVQDKVNAMLLGKTGSTKMSSVSSTAVKQGVNVIKNTLNKPNAKRNTATRATDEGKKTVKTARR